MGIRNKIMINFCIESGCIQEAGEASYRWSTVNFQIYNDLFADLIKEAVEEWLGENTLEPDYVYEVIFAHTVEHDGGGAVTGEYFEPIHTEVQAY